jgi:hypothetical protein
MLNEIYKKIKNKKKLFIFFFLVILILTIINIVFENRRNEEISLKDYEKLYDIDAAFKYQKGIRNFGYFEINTKINKLKIDDYYLIHDKNIDVYFEKYKEYSTDNKITNKEFSQLANFLVEIDKENQKRKVEEKIENIKEKLK